MIFSFITNKDIDVSLKEYFLNQVVNGDHHVIKKAEGAAFSLIKSALNSRYDLAKLFPLIKEWNTAQAYLEGEYSCKNDIIYKALSDNTGNAPATGSTYWVEDDPRDMLLVLHCVNITIYYLLKRISPRKVTQEVDDCYHMALDWLEDVKRERENPDFPLIDTDTGIGGLEVRGGSNEKIDHYY